jgi:hypothetical protein
MTLRLACDRERANHSRSIRHQLSFLQYHSRSNVGEGGNAYPFLIQKFIFCPSRGIDICFHLECQFTTLTLTSFDKWLQEIDIALSLDWKGGHLDIFWEEIETYRTKGGESKCMIVTWWFASLKKGGYTQRESAGDLRD